MLELAVLLGRGLLWIVVSVPEAIVYATIKLFGGDAKKKEELFPNSPLQDEGGEQS